MALQLDSDAAVWHKLWSVRVSLVGATFTGIWAALPSFQNLLHPAVFAAICVIVSIATVVARLLDQPSIPRVGDPNA